jgi:sugar fermentation stimulation protein A
MDFGQLLEGTLVDRYKRFFADVRLRNGHVVVTHCANPGSMRNCRPDNARVWVSRSDNPKRKLRYTWELVEVEDTLVCVNTARANTVVAEAIERGDVPELAGYDDVRREVKVGDSRIDIMLARGADGGERCFVEVKSVTLGVGDGVSAFPDSVTERGARHLRELMKLAAGGTRAAMLFCCGRADTRVMRPADEIDPVYGATLREAAAAGVELYAYRCEISAEGMWLRERVPVEL